MRKGENLMEKGIDLHVHSTYSDGTCSVHELVAMAKEKGLLAIALTDHDTVKGISVMKQLCAKENIPFVPGIELSTEYTFTNSDSSIEVHLLGLFIDDSNSCFEEYEAESKKIRLNRDQIIVEKLQQHGFDITIESLYKAYSESIITRAHIARYLVDTKQIANRNEVFKKYLGDGCSCYVDRKKIKTKDAISLVHKAGGLAIIAHPPLYNLTNTKMELMISDLKNSNLDGVEAVYSTYHNNDEQEMKYLAKKYNLLISGGSDFHGENKPYIHLGTGRGNLYIPFEIYQKLYAYHLHH